MMDERVPREHVGRIAHLLMGRERGLPGEMFKSGDPG